MFARGKRGGPAAPVVPTAAPSPIGPPPDEHRVAAVGAVLQSCFIEIEHPLDDHLTALMLQLTIEPDGPAGAGVETLETDMSKGAPRGPKA